MKGWQKGITKTKIEALVPITIMGIPKIEIKVLIPITIMGTTTELWPWSGNAAR